MAHSSSAATHEDNRGKVCAPCGSKVNPKSCFILDPKFKYLDLVKQYINPNFDINDSHYPKVLCSVCKKALLSKEGGKEISLPVMPNYPDISLAKVTRANQDEICHCYICLTARNRGRLKVKRGRGNKRKLSPEIKIGLVAAKEEQPNKRRSDPKEYSSAYGSASKMCTTCKGEIGRGIQHNCKDTKAPENLIRSMEKLPEKAQEQVITSFLKNKAEKEIGKNKNAELKLATKGRVCTVVLNPDKPEEIPQVSCEQLDVLQSGLGNASNTQMKGVANWLRATFKKRSIVSTGYKDHLVEETSKLSDLYHVNESISLDGEGGVDVKRPIIYANCEEIVERVCIERGYLGSPSITVMADGGGGFFKVCCTIIPEDYDFDAVRMENSTRSTYDEGGSVRKGKPTGVTRVILLAIVPEIKETHKNLKIIFDLIKLNNISFNIVSDYKVQLIILGLQTATSSFPCPYCYVTLSELADLRYSEENLEPKKERTFGSLQEDHNDFMTKLNGDKKKAKYCNSRVNKSLLDEDPSRTVLDKYTIPELHSILGFVNHLFFDGLCPLLSKEKALLWPMKLNLVAKGYHGGTLEGNACRHLLRNADKLLDPEIIGETPIEKVEPFITTLKCFNSIVGESFGTSIVVEDMEKIVCDFTKSYLQTDLTITLKVHVIMCHLVSGLKSSNLKGRGLGVCTEQSGESIHFHFLHNFWGKWKVSSLDHPDYSSYLWKATVECASKAM